MLVRHALLLGRIEFHTVPLYCWVVSHVRKNSSRNNTRLVVAPVEFRNARSLALSGSLPVMFLCPTWVPNLLGLDRDLTACKFPSNGKAASLSPSFQHGSHSLLPEADSKSQSVIRKLARSKLHAVACCAMRPRVLELTKLVPVNPFTVAVAANAVRWSTFVRGRTVPSPNPLFRIY